MIGINSDGYKLSVPALSIFFFRERYMTMQYRLEFDYKGRGALNKRSYWYTVELARLI